MREARLTVPATTEDKELARIKKIIDDANHSREGSREPLVKLLDQYPTITAMVGDIAQIAEDSVLETSSGGNVLVTETMRQHISVMRKDLAQSGDGDLERLLIERVVLCWQALNSAEALRADKWRPRINTEEADFWDRHVSRLNNDFLKACKTLATVRRLLRPTLAQVNIAEKQVNVATGGGEAV